MKNSRTALLDCGHFTVIISKIEITWVYKNTIYDIIQGEKIIHYWNNQGLFPTKQNENIDWNMVQDTRTKLPFDRKI